MQSGSTANTASVATLTGLTYIDALVSGATAQGLFSINLSSDKLNAAGISTLKGLGYTITLYHPENNSDIPSRYLISW